MAKKKDKLAIIICGGGMTSSYSVGVLEALKFHYGIENPFTIIASSGGAANAAYYVAGQLPLVRRIWTNYVPNKDFVNPKRLSKIMDVDYLVDEVFKKKEKLDVKKVKSSKTTLYISSINAKTGKIRYFSSNEDYSIFNIIKASKAVPFIYGKSVKIGNNFFHDSMMFSTLQHHVMKALSLGANKLIVIHNQRKVSFLEKISYGLWLMMKGRYFSKGFREEIKKGECFDIPSDDSICIIEPRKKHILSPYNNNSDAIESVINQGLDETINNKELESFLK